MSAEEVRCALCETPINGAPEPGEEPICWECETKKVAGPDAPAGWARCFQCGNGFHRSVLPPRLREAGVCSAVCFAERVRVVMDRRGAPYNAVKRWLPVAERDCSECGQKVPVRERAGLDWHSRVLCESCAYFETMAKSDGERPRMGRCLTCGATLLADEERRWVGCDTCAGLRPTAEGMTAAAIMPLPLPAPEKQTAP